MSREKLKRNLMTFVQLFLREGVVLRKEFFSNVVDNLVWPATTALLWGYVLPHVPQLGVSSQYATFIFVGAIVAIWFYTCIEYAFLLANDCEGNRRIDYELCLPIPPRLIILKYGFAFAFHSFVISFPLLFMGKLFLFEQFDMSMFSFTKFLVTCMLGNMVFAFFCLWVAGWASSSFFVHMRIRFFDPLFYFGCDMSTWLTLATALPFLGYLMLLNPITYGMEAMRSAVLGPAGLLNFWLSSAMLCVHLGVWMMAAIKTFEKKLDYVRI